MRGKRQAIIEQRAEREAILKSIRVKELRQKHRYESGESRAKKPVSFALSDTGMSGIAYCIFTRGSKTAQALRRRTTNPGF